MFTKSGQTNLRGSNRQNELHLGNKLVDTGSDEDIEPNRGRKTGKTTSKDHVLSSENDKQNTRLRGTGQTQKMFTTAKKSGRRSPGALANKKGLASPKKSKPSVIEAMSQNSMYMELANMHGYQIHPKQQSEILRESQVRQMLSSSATIDQQTQQVLTRASAIQAAINNSTNMYSSIQSKTNQDKLNESVNQIISTKQFENELKESIAQKVAKEIAENIRASYQNSYKLNNTSLPEDKSQSNQDDDSFSAVQKSASRKKLTKRQKLAQLSKGTFSSNQKSSNLDHSMQLIDYTLQSDRHLMDSQVNSFSKKKKTVKVKRKVDALSVEEDDPQMDTIDGNMSMDFSLSRSKSTHQKLIAPSVTQGKRNMQASTQAPFQREHRKKVKSQSNLRNPHIGSKVKNKKQEFENEELVDKISSRLNESAIELSEKMKMISINELCRLTSDREETKTALVLSDHDHERTLEPKGSVSPGAAPSVAPQASKYTNQFLQLNKVDLFPKPNQSQFPGSTMERHQKNKNSIIPEATEEYIHYTSNTPERRGETYGKASTLKQTLKATKKNSPSWPKEEDTVLMGKKKSTGHSFSKTRVLKKSVTQNNYSSPQSGRSQGMLMKNKYYSKINKRYTDAVRSTSRGGANHSSSRNTDREFASKSVLVGNVYGSKPSRNSNKRNFSHLNINDEFEMIEKTIQVKIPNKQTLQPHDQALVSLAKPKQNQDQEVSKTNPIEDKPNVYFQRKNSSPSPFRLKGLQQKYSQSESREAQIGETKEFLNQYKPLQVKNQYLQPLLPMETLALDTPEPKLRQDESYEDLDDGAEQVAVQSQGSNQGLAAELTERRSPKTHQIDLNSERTASSGQEVELKLSREPRRSRKDRSRENVLSKHRPMSHNVESLAIPKKAIQVYSNALEQPELTSTNNRMLEGYMHATSDGEQAAQAQVFSDERVSIPDAPTSAQGQSFLPRDDVDSQGSSERLRLSKTEQEAAKEQAKTRTTKKVSAKRGTEKKSKGSAQKKTALQQIFGGSRYQGSSQLVASLQQSSEQKGATALQQKATNTRALRSSFGPSSSQTKTVSKQTTAKKASQVELTPIKMGTKASQHSQLKNQYVDRRLVQKKTPGTTKEEPGSEPRNSATKQKKKTSVQPQAQIEQANSTRKQHGMSDGLLQETQSRPNPFVEQLSYSFDKALEQAKTTSGQGTVAKKPLTNQNKRQISKTKSELKVVRAELSTVLKGLTVLNFRETEAIRKPQRYMVFSASLFMTVFELITKVDKVIHASQKTKRTIKEKINKDLFDDLGAEQLALDEESEQLDIHMAKRLQRRLLVRAEQDLSALNQLLPLDAHSKLQANKTKPRDAEKAVLEEWNRKLRPYLYQVNSNMIALIQQIQKPIKAMVAFNSGDVSDLNEIEKFATKLLDFCDSHTLLTQSCLKGSGQSSTLFRQLLTIVHLSAVFINKKTQLTIQSLDQRPNDPYPEVFGTKDIHRDTSSPAVSSERSDDVGEEQPLQATEKHSQVTNVWLSPHRAELERRSDQIAQEEGKQAYGEVKYAENSIDIQLNEGAQITQASNQNTAEAKSENKILVDHQYTNKSDQGLASSTKQGGRLSQGPLDRLIQMRTSSKQVFEYENKSESPCRDSLGFSIKLIKVELDSKGSGTLSITGKGSVRASTKSQPQSERSSANNGQHDGVRDLNTSEPSEKASEEMEYALDQLGPEGSAKEGMQSIFNLREDEMMEIMPTAEQNCNTLAMEQENEDDNQAHSVVEEAKEVEGPLRTTILVSAVVDDFKSSAEGSPLAGKVTIVDDFNSLEGDNTVEEAANKEEAKQNHDSVPATPNAISENNFSIEVAHKRPEQDPVFISIMNEEEVPEPKEDTPLPTATMNQPQSYQSLDSLHQPTLATQTQHARVDSKVMSEVQDDAAERRSSDDVVDIIQRLQKNVDAMREPAQIPPHKRRKSQNPYLAAANARPEVVEPLAAQENELATPKNAGNKKTSVDSAKKLRSPKKKKAQQSSVGGEKLPIQYGLYNPDTGIIVYKVDPDFDDEEDFFRIKPVKIVLRASASAVKTAGRRSPLTGSSAKNCSSRRSKASRQTNESSKQSSNLQNQLNVTRQKLNSNAVVRSRARPQRSSTKSKPHDGEEECEEMQPPAEDCKTADSGNKHNTTKGVEITPFGEHTDQDQSHISVLSDAFQQRVGDTTNPYSSNHRRDATSNDSRGTNFMKSHLRQSLEERRRMRSLESQKREGEAQ